MADGCLIDELLKLVISIFHVDLEECTLSLLRVVVPAYLTSMDKASDSQTPRNPSRKVTVTCIFAILMGGQEKLFQESIQPSIQELLLPKRQRKLEDESSSEESPLSMAVTEFFNVIQASVLDTCTVSPRMHFAVRFLEMAALRGRHRAPRLIFSRLNMNVITHLIKVVPDLFNIASSP
ncbi:Mediator of RNA polymerase II transcription subunit 24like, partial [Caligus rogercresseyi]